MSRHVRITIGDNRRGEVLVDGQPVRGVRGIALEATARGMPRVELDLAATLAEYDGPAIVDVPPALAEALILLGWTPPRDQP